MSRKLLLSNGELHVGLNAYNMVHDFYFPYVGQENHAAARSLRHRIGLWIEGDFSWLDDGSWEFSFAYHHQALIGRTTATNHKLSIRLEFDDCVDASQAAFLRNIQVFNLADKVRDIRLFMHQVFIISNSNDGDTAQYLPDVAAIMHYKGHRVFIASASYSDGRPADGFSVGLFGIEGHEGTYRDAEDGQLSGNAVEHGKVDSVLGLYMTIEPHDSQRVHYWIAVGTSQREALKIHSRLKKNGLLHYLLHTVNHWKLWLAPTLAVADRIKPELRQKFIESVMLIKASQDKRGAVMASTDTSMLNYARDAYAYCWPRDGVYALWPLLRIGYKDELVRFFSYCRRSMHEDGYLGHKYLADGSLGSSWHPYLQPSGLIGPPIQEDETASVLFLFGQYYDRHHDDKLLTDYYPTFVAPMANFLCGYMDPITRLPLPSYNLWEEVYQTNTYTIATVYAALIEAAKLAEVLGKDDDAVRWRNTADDIQAHAQEMMWNESRGYFYRGFLRTGENYSYDETIDVSSLFGAFMFGLFDINSSHMLRAFQTLKNTLLIDEQPGLVRYEYDKYNLCQTDSLGNPWAITTLWLSQYYIENGDHDKAMEALNWVSEKSDETGTIAEQYDPLSGNSVSVSPLTWSQAEYVSTLLDLITDPDTAEDTD